MVFNPYMEEIRKQARRERNWNIVAWSVAIIGTIILLSSMWW